MGSKKADTSGYGAAMASQQKYLDELKRVQEEAPSEDALKIQDFKDYQLAGLMNAEDYGTSAYENIEEDPRLQRAQMQALQELQSRGATGMTPEEREQYRQFQEDASAQEMARQATLAQQAAQTGNSGAGLAAQIASSQAAAQRQAEGGRQMGADLAAARRQALAQAANAATGMSQADLQRQSAVAQAQDEFSKLNTGNRQNISQYNLENRQRVGEQNTDLENQKRLQNIDAVQQAYQNKLGAVTAQGSTYGNMSNISMAQAGSAVPGVNKGKAALGGAATGASAGAAAGPYGALIGAGVGGAAGYFSAADGGVVHAQNGYSMADLQRQDRAQLEPMLREERKEQRERDALTAGMTPLSTDTGDLTSEESSAIRNDANIAAAEQESQQSSSPNMMGAIGGGASALSGILGGGKEEAKAPIMPSISSGPGTSIENIMSNSKLGGTRFQRNSGLARMADGGFAYADGGIEHDGSGALVPSLDGKDYAGDRIDAKLNANELVLNVEQQQRLLDAIKGKRSMESLGEQDIVLEPSGHKAALPPSDQDIEARGLKKLIKMLGME